MLSVHDECLHIAGSGYTILESSSSLSQVKFIVQVSWFPRNICRNKCIKIKGVELSSSGKATESIVVRPVVHWYMLSALNKIKKLELHL